MSQEQLSALLAKLKEDAGLQEQLKGAADLDAAAAIARQAGFDVTKDDWASHQSRRSYELRDEDLEAISGGAESGKSTSFCRAGDNCCA